MQSLEEYKNLIAVVDRQCRGIISRHPDQIACTRGCAGNCCRIHLSLYPVEALSMALALEKMAPPVRDRIKHKARHTNSFGPCPLLEDGACLMYDARAVICRTHGLPMLTEYRGQRSVGYCEKNFQHLSPIPDEDIIDLAWLNTSLSEVNQKFVRATDHWISPGQRLTIGEALLLNRKANTPTP